MISEGLPEARGSDAAAHFALLIVTPHNCQNIRGNQREISLKIERNNSPAELRAETFCKVLSIVAFELVSANCARGKTAVW